MPSRANARSRAWREIVMLSRELGRADRRLAILGEGNTSIRVSPDTFLIKASGANLATLTAADATECRLSALLPLLGKKHVDDAAIDKVLLAARVSPAAKKPSVEALFHACLLTLPGINVVGHTHPVAVNQVLCSRHARVFAARRLFPDEVVCCGQESVFVPYVDPGLSLAQAIRSAVESFLKRRPFTPRLILLGSHGLIALGPTPPSVIAATLMAEKAAEIFIGASTLGPRFLARRHVERIAGRADEQYRQKALGL